MDAGEEGGELITRPLVFNGRFPFVNVDAKSGRLQVEVLDEAGKIIEPYALDACVPVEEEGTKLRVEWNGVEDLAPLRGQKVRFRFCLQRGRLYSFWVSEKESGESGGFVGAGGPGFAGNRDVC